MDGVIGAEIWSGNWLDWWICSRGSHSEGWNIVSAQSNQHWWMENMWNSQSLNSNLKIRPFFILIHSVFVSIEMFCPKFSVQAFLCHDGWVSTCSGTLLLDHSCLGSFITLERRRFSNLVFSYNTCGHGCTVRCSFQFTNVFLVFYRQRWQMSPPIRSMLKKIPVSNRNCPKQFCGGWNICFGMSVFTFRITDMM